MVSGSELIQWLMSDEGLSALKQGLESEADVHTVNAHPPLLDIGLGNARIIAYVGDKTITDSDLGRAIRWAAQREPDAILFVAGGISDDIVSAAEYLNCLNLKNHGKEQQGVIFAAAQAMKRGETISLSFASRKEIVL